MVVGIKDLTERQFEDWKASHHEAAIALENREERLDAVYDEIERDLVLLGATAIEDKLQVRNVFLNDKVMFSIPFCGRYARVQYVKNWLMAFRANISWKCSFPV